MRCIFNFLNILIHNRFIIFVAFILAFAINQYCFNKTLLPSNDTKDLWFYSGIFMVLFSILFIEPYYSSPKNVMTNVIPLLLVFFAIKSSLNNNLLWWFAVIILLVLLLTSIIAMTLDDNRKSPDHIKNKISYVLKNIVVLFGQGRVLYSSVFIYFLLTNYFNQNLYTLIFFVLWFLILSINPKNIHNIFIPITKKEKGNQIGEIFGVQSKKIFLVKLFEDRKRIKKFDIVKFRYSMQDENDLTITGIVFDTYLLNQEKWAKILQLADPKKEDVNLKKNIVYKLTDTDEINRLSRELKTESFVGIVIDGSCIGKLKFEYSKKKDDLQEGDLLELKIGLKRLFYQVVTGTTEKEKLEARNETGFIEGEAIQLGEWQNNKLSFQKFGWVPPINTPLFIADTSDITLNTFSYPDYHLGVIPGTNLPSIINLHIAISHHIALLGITGSGKSFLTREILNQIKNDTRIVCIDFTGEWKIELDKIHQVNSPLNNTSDIQTFLTNTDDNIGIIELPSLSNTVEVVKKTGELIDSIFSFAKSCYERHNMKKICLILEEAHTIVPEEKFLGVNNYDCKAIVNKISQIALQGRKYGVGLFVIAQRTANVSKTVLTQCNTVICFQAFDETSFNFLSNYVGKDMILALPNLKQFHAIVTGKAIKSNMPMIVDLRRTV